DFDGWARLGNSGWAYGDLLRYFRRSEHNVRGASETRGTGGPQHVSDLRDPHPLARAFVDAAVQVGIPRADDFNDGKLEGVGLAQVTLTRGRRCRTADGYLKPVERRANLTVMTGAHVTRLVVENGRAIGVACVRDGAPQTFRSEREVILSGGAFNSPQLL